nr:polysaccharide deacetylase family protein [uncultured Desulfobacter sp.]
MSILHHLLAKAYVPLKLTNAARYSLGMRCPHRLRILIYHDIAPHEQERFASQLRWIKRYWNFVSPAQFVDIMESREPISGDNVLLTFDDGFASNRQIAENILGPLGIKALFFIVSKFTDLTDKMERLRFISKNICPNLDKNNIPPHLHNMNWSDLTYLLDTGHTIGAHTCSHARLSGLNNKRELNSEIVSGADQLERMLGIKVTHFAYPYGDCSSISPEAIAVAKQRFNFIYTGMRGNNTGGTPSWALRRDAIAPHNSLDLAGSLLEGGADWRYTKHLSRYESMGRGSQ